MCCLTEEWQGLIAVRNRLNSTTSNFFISMSGLYGDACYDVMYKFAQVLQVAANSRGVSSQGVVRTNHIMATKLAITTNKHKTVTQNFVFFSTRSSRGTRVDMAICSRMQKWKTKPDTSCRWSLTSWFTVFRITGTSRWKRLSETVAAVAICIHRRMDEKWMMILLDHYTYWVKPTYILAWLRYYVYTCSIGREGI